MKSNPGDGIKSSITSKPEFEIDLLILYVMYRQKYVMVGTDPVVCIGMCFDGYKQMDGNAWHW